jgi:hypothetical protein
MMEREIIHGSLNEVTRRLWEGSLSYRVLGVDSIPPLILSQSSRGATVDISGAWHGSVLVQTTPALALDVACVMFDQERSSLLGSHSIPPKERPTDAMIADCLKEIANITAGNLKTALPEPCTLSIPSHCSFEIWDTTRSLGAVFTELSFKCENCPLEDGYFRISLIKHAHKFGSCVET